MLGETAGNGFGGDVASGGEAGARAGDRESGDDDLSESEPRIASMLTGLNC